jgi:DNA-binding MarR family transcriptional regulator
MEEITILRSDLLKLRILKYLFDKKDHTPSELSIILNTNGNTLLRNSKFLELLGLIEIDLKKTNGNYYFLKITSFGYEFYQKNKEAINKLIEK